MTLILMIEAQPVQFFTISLATVMLRINFSRNWMSSWVLRMK